MAQACPRCKAPVSDEIERCRECGADLDPCGTILPPGPRQNRVAPTPSSARPASRPSRPSSLSADSHDPAPAPAPARPRRPRPRPEPPPPQAHAATPSGAYPPVPPQPQVPTPAPAPPPGAYYYPASHGMPPVPASQAEGAGPGGVRGWMIRMLGGSAPAGAPGPYYGGMPGAPSGITPPPTGSGFGSGSASSVTPIPPGSGWPAPSSVVSPFAPAPAGPATPAEAPSPHEAASPSPLYAPTDDDGATRFLGGVDLGKLRIPKYTYVLQILDLSGQWRDWGPIHASGMNVGRAKTSADFPGLSTMAVKHMKFRYEKTTLMVEDLGSLNGVYLRISQPVPLIDGMRFRVGNQAIEFHAAEPFDAVPPIMAEDGEEYCSRDLEPLAYLDMIRPNGRPGLRFPITRPDPTIIGREGPSAHIALTNDNAVSGKHAAIRREDGTFLLEDLRSRNGTFIHILGAHPVKSGDVLLAGRVLFRVHDQSGG